MTTTPLEREILTHYWVSAEPYVCRSKVHEEAIEKFCKLGLLIETNSLLGGLKRYRANMEALRPFMEALDAVPLPVQRWEVPTPDKALCKSCGRFRAATYVHAGQMAHGSCAYCHEKELLRRRSGGK